MTASQYIIGLDWGRARVGVALADMETRIAFARDIVPTEKIIDYIARDLVSSYDIHTIIIGVPTHGAYEENKKAIRIFGEKITRATGIAVVYADEMFTTRMAQQKLREVSDRKDVRDDAEAARILLQEWLDRGESQNN